MFMVFPRRFIQPRLLGESWLVSGNARKINKLIVAHSDMQKSVNFGLSGRSVVFLRPIEVREVEIVCCWLVKLTYVFPHPRLFVLRDTASAGANADVFG